MILLGKGLCPDIWVSDIYSINLGYLKDIGIKALFFDIDNTLIQYSDHESDDRLDAWLEKVLDEGFGVGFLSNGKDERIFSFAEKVTVKGETLTKHPNFKVTGSARKPLSKGFRKLAGKFNLKKDKVAMVGDQLFTDILGGNWFGCYTILVDPINRDDDHWFVTFKRHFEKPFLKKFKKS